jgi:hypothetical protein
MSSGAEFEFFRTRPITRAQAVAGGVLPHLLLVLLLSAAMLVPISLDTFNGTGFLARALRWRPPSARTIRDLREILGATFLPRTWPAGGLSPDAWLALRPLLHAQVLKVALLLLAMPFAGASIRIPLPRLLEGRSRWLDLPLTIALVPVAFGVLGFLERWWAPPLWLATLIAAAAVWQWWRLAWPLLSLPEVARPRPR